MLLDFIKIIKHEINLDNLFINNIIDEKYYNLIKMFIYFNLV